MLSGFVKPLGDALVPAARTWIRYAPMTLGKAWLWDRIHWRHRSFQCITQQGMRVTGNTRDLIQSYLYYFGVWEPNITHWMCSTLKRGDAFIDVGANIGYYTLLASRIVGDEGKVVSVEAAGWIHAILDRHVRLNALKNVRTVLAAAAEVSGTVRIRPGGADNIGLTRTVAGTAVDGLETEVVALPLRDILRDDEVAKARIIKIDVEGFELSALRGLEPVMHLMRPDVEIVVEIAAGLLAEVGHSVNEIFSIMRGHGFSAFVIENDYSAQSYLSKGAFKPPTPLASTPGEISGDILFSRARY